jgi:hypothetical protein
LRDGLEKTYAWIYDQIAADRPEGVRRDIVRA